ncbi:phosphoribosyltransferase [Nonomuraea sp. NN258]|uniref:phosphoribosyltransferase n=1 Tax=Nonomuraea antri TaxID=2730852 RepID=UPI00156812DA|nr:phosphoribosyltransferase family protein [Nonomuraea antri]NRQ30532.1 phosphoribosyltransferase [Nonomuraea antri]
MELFADRAEAGRLLAERLPESRDPVVLALPRGGVAVAVPVARRLGGDLDVLVTRKIGYPPQPELGVGAVAEGGDPVFDEGLLNRLGMTPESVSDVVEQERRELERRVRAYRGGRPLPALAGREVIVVDDGLATGGTARAALRAVRGAGPAKVTLAVPVGARDTVEAMEAEADEVVVLRAPADFRAVGQWYAEFDQLTDADVLELLAEGRGDA